MKRQEIIEKLCTVVGLVYNSQNDYSHASDCFCDAKKETVVHDGKTLDYVLSAVFDKLRRDGYDPSEAMDAFDTLAEVDGKIQFAEKTNHSFLTI